MLARGGCQSEQQQGPGTRRSLQAIRTCCIEGPENAIVPIFFSRQGGGHFPRAGPSRVRGANDEEGSTARWVLHEGSGASGPGVTSCGAGRDSDRVPRADLSSASATSPTLATPERPTRSDVPLLLLPHDHRARPSQPNPATAPALEAGQTPVPPSMATPQRTACHAVIRPPASRFILTSRRLLSRAD